MGLEIEDRPSDSPYVERVWRSRSFAVDRMMSVANPYPELVFWGERGRIRVAVQGPETRAGLAPVPPDTWFFGITFSLGTAFHHLPARLLLDGGIELPEVTGRRFELAGSHWFRPGFGTAERFVGRLVREGVLGRDPVVAAAADDHRPAVSLRTVQRRYLATTGLTPTAVRQILRARQAAMLIMEGMPPVEVVHRLGYFDQPHLTRSLARYIGRTVRQLRTTDPAEPLSLLYKTEPPPTA
ncbi:helix-turn-helix domain-containing protein [Microlunatus parietis]